MRSNGRKLIQDVALPWSDGSLSARMWQAGKRVVVGVPELGLHCYGTTQSEAVFRLFTSLLKYYRQLKKNRAKLNDRGVEHLRLLRKWVEAVEIRMVDPAVASTRS